MEWHACVLLNFDVPNAWYLISSILFLVLRVCVFASLCVSSVCLHASEARITQTAILLCALNTVFVLCT